jgi:dTDP-4-dehydrorhamnose 3,5-epimerase/CDP-3, 6-dideoxy-D-glycero-D-glycero-4-hexulose-5-epimerase
MEIINTHLPDLYVINKDIFKDTRGKYVKTFYSPLLEANNLLSIFKENAFVTSKKNVLRGLHFQLPPYESCKLIHVIEGSILDVVININKNSHFFGSVFAYELSSKNNKSLYVGSQYAHGFLTLSKQSIVSYMSTNTFNPKYERGVKWDSFGFDWKVENPILSEKDQKLPHFGEWLNYD